MNYGTSSKSRFVSEYLLIVCAFAILGLGLSCNNDSSAQNNETDFTESYSGSFQSAPASTDTNDDGRPANVGQFQGTSTFGSVSIQSLNEFEAALENAVCSPGEIEFTLVQGNFVKRFADGDLLFGTWESGVSCFDPVTGTSVTTQTGTFSGGTGEFVNAAGPVQIDFTSTFLASSGVDGYNFGGSSGSGFGTVIFNGN